MVQNRGVWRLITLNHPILLQHLVDFFPLVFPFVKKTILDDSYLTVWFSGFSTGLMVFVSIFVSIVSIT